MKLAAGDVIKAVYEILNGKINSNSYTISYEKRVEDAGGTLIGSSCIPIYFTETLPVYTSQSPDFQAEAYVYIYHLNTNEVGAVDEFMYDVAVSVKCAIQTRLGVASPQDINAMGNAVGELLQPNTFARIEINGFSVTSQYCLNIRYNEPQVVDSRLESSVTMDWLIRVESL